ncbi:MAG: hypothetical protein ACI4JY_02525 [Oscillospiraceae bacterium]
MSQYTDFVNHEITECDFNPFELDINATLEILNSKTYFRPFSEGLTMLLSETFSSEEMSSTQQKADLLYTALRNIGSDIAPDTVLTWLNDQHRPERSAFIEICFALHLNLEQCKRAFSHVYFDRCFNCHNKKELIYYYCIKHNLSQQTANELIEEFKTDNHFDAPNKDAVYTSYIRKEVDSLESMDMLRKYLAEHEWYFSSCNIKAKEYISSIIENLRGSDYDKAYVAALRKYKNQRANHKMAEQPDDLLEHCSLTLRWLKQNSVSDETFLESLKSAQLTSDSFIFRTFLDGTDGIKKNADILEYVRKNFPSKQRLYSILNNDESTQYDSVRRSLILFHFIEFWSKIEIGMSPEMSDMDLDRRFIIYCDNINAILNDCDYEQLYAGSPFDWLVMFLSKHEKPIEELKMFLSEIESNF